MPVALQSHGFTMKHQPAQLHETMAFIARDHAEMVSTLAIALAIDRIVHCKCSYRNWRKCQTVNRSWSASRDHARG